MNQRANPDNPWANNSGEITEMKKVEIGIEPI